MSQNTFDHRTLGVTFTTHEAQVRVWAPMAESAAIKLCNQNIIVPLQKDGNYWQTSLKELQSGDTYKFVLNGTLERPDPASLAQPEGVHGPSQAVDTARFIWSDVGWHNFPLDDYLLYELHTGTFTPEGTFAGIESRLDYLLELGITAIEIMPVAQFPGTRNWGYDGVFPYAVQQSYGGAAGLQQLVNACHRKGLAVVLDVVYNHMGPEGNYFTDYGPYFTSKYQTPWGNALNFDDNYSDSVRRYFIENVLMWFRDFHIDALRIDAAHAIHDNSNPHLLREMKQYVDELMQQTGRQHYLIVESDLNETRFIQPLSEPGGYGMDAQWNDEFHHALRVTAGGERNGYYADFNGIQHLAKAYKDAYVYDGAYVPRRAKIVGKSTAGHAGRQFVVFSQNHDQVGNRMLGERPGQLVSFEMQKLMAGAVMSSPYLPMLFMGEEWGETNPFLYFVSHSDMPLIKAVRQGRKREFADFQEPFAAPDPQDEETFAQSKLNWARLNQEPHKTIFQYYKALLMLRKQSSLCHPNRESVAVGVDEEQQTLTLFRQHSVRENDQSASEETVVCLMNFSKETRSLRLPENSALWRNMLDSASPKWHGPMAALQTVASDEPVIVQPESILIYTNK